MAPHALKIDPTKIFPSPSTFHNHACQTLFDFRTSQTHMDSYIHKSSINFWILLDFSFDTRIMYEISWFHIKLANCQQYIKMVLWRQEVLSCKTSHEKLFSSIENQEIHIFSWAIYAAAVLPGFHWLTIYQTLKRNCKYNHGKTLMQRLNLSSTVGSWIKDFKGF